MVHLTPHRRTILDHLTHCGGTRSAAEVHAALPSINLVTVYRVLDYLVKAGLVKKFTLTDEEAVYEVQAEPHHHAICTECGKVLHFTTDDTELRKEFSLPGFRVDDLEVVLHGRCSTHRS